VCAEGDAGFEVGGKFFVEDWGDFGEILDDDLEIRVFTCEDSIIMAS
jgi:hypothetical protein